MLEVETLPYGPFSWRRLKPAIFCLGLLLLGACQTPVELPASVSSIATPVGLPSAQASRYVIRSDLSAVRFLVYRAGLLASFGHNHVIEPTMLGGELYLANDFQRSSFSLVIPFVGAQVDAATARAEEGEHFAKQPDVDAIAGTTKNMLKLLDAERYPQIDIRSLAVVGPAWAPDVTVRIKLHGVERDMVVPVAIAYRGEQLTATAVFEIKQSDFGITPLSILGGALQVADSVKVRLRIVAQKA